MVKSWIPKRTAWWDTVATMMMAWWWWWWCCCSSSLRGGRGLCYAKVVWEGPIDLPVIAAAMANFDDGGSGKILMWSGAYLDDSSYRHGLDKKTWTTVWDPAALNNAMALLVDTAEHDMFCPGTSVLSDGRIMVTGGSTNAATSFYDDGGWERGAAMKIGRGYHSNTVLTDGSVFVLGGSWYDNQRPADFRILFGPFWGPILWNLRYSIFSRWFFDWLKPWPRKDGEVWNVMTNQWRTLKNVKCDGSVLTNDVQGQYSNDNHMWLFQAPNGKIFQAGPSVMTHWITTGGDGSVVEAVRRGSMDAMNGNAVMYDIGKILTLGGAENYRMDSPATTEAYVLTLDSTGTTDHVTVRRVGNLHQARTMHNSIVLPTGQVVVIGGKREATTFDDRLAVLTAELWDPDTGLFTELTDAPMQRPRTYHSAAILLRDGRILAAGGGLCGQDCEYNYFDGEIMTPPYLFTSAGDPAPRPVIVDAPTIAVAGDSLVVRVAPAPAVNRFALVRLSAVTHSINNDARRIPLPIVSTTTGDDNGVFHTMQLPANPAVSLTGTYFLFAMTDAGVPSVATTLSIAPPVLTIN